MVFRAKPGYVFKLRVKDNAGHSGTFTTGATDRAVAGDVERMVKGFRAQRKWAYLTAIATKRVPLAVVYDHFVLGDLEPYMVTALAAAADVDLDPLITEWARTANAKFVKQVRTLIPAGKRFSRSMFTRAELKARLLKLNVGPNTRRKYKAALSSLAKALVETDVLDTSPVRDIVLTAPPRSDKALRALTMEQAKRNVLAHEGEQRAIEATMAGSGAEWQAIERLHRRDVDVEHKLIYAHGSKTARYGAFRDRWIEVTEDWAWDILVPWVKGLHPDAPVFRRGEGVAVRVHQRIARALKLPATTLHQYRHTFAKTWIARGAAGDLRPDGRNLQWLKNQLGHAPESTLALDTYGVDIKAARLTEQQKARMGQADEAATKPATSPRKHARRHA